MASLNATSVLSRPGSLYKDSAAELAVVVRMESASRRSFEQLISEALLQPVHMRNTRMQLTHAVADHPAYGQLVPYDAERFPAPLIGLGQARLDSVSSNLEHRSRPAVALLNTRRTFVSAPGGLDEHRQLSEAGSVYGCTSEISLFPDEGLAPVTVVSVDSATPALRRLHSFAAPLRVSGHRRRNRTQYGRSDALPVTLARRVQGHYCEGSASLDIRPVEGRTFLEAAGVVAELRREGEHWVIDDVNTYRDGVRVDAAGGTVTLHGVVYRRSEWKEPSAPPALVAGLIGEYGWEHNAIRVY